MAAKKPEPEIEAMPAEERLAQVRAAVAAQPRVAGYMADLAANPPQVLLLEGGNAAQRAGLAFQWAARLNCCEPNHGPNGGEPCYACRACRNILSTAHRDLFLLEGESGYIKIDQVRAVRSVLGEPPRDDGYRVVILTEAQALTIEAANSLLKSLEEPRPLTTFLLLAPQRERLLPTLVSRGWVLTLSWDAEPAPDEEGVLDEWMPRFLEFYRTGRGLFAHTGARGGVDRPLVRRIATAHQRALANALCTKPKTPLGQLFAERMGPENLRRADVALAEAHDALDAFVNPALTLDWLATRIWTLANR